ncbi:MAG: hypothetical protein QM728_03435 [Gordonia sp. (in: high G+C Gram-positive bacteria)]|uniref:hypothetical protein n=1 Tax=Gordonia sp. (in: high G+C Gram-positive bacteria) TaxID=84139 RepID=UPI0039E51AAB
MAATRRRPLLPGALAWSGRTFGRDPLPVLGATAAWGLILVAITATAIAVMEHGGMDFENDDDLDRAAVYLTFILAVPLALCAAGGWHGLLTLADKNKAAFVDFFRFPTLAAQLVVAVVTTVASAPLTFIRSDLTALAWTLALVFLLVWATLLAAEGLSGSAALVGSVRLSLHHPLATLAGVSVLLVALVLGTVIVLAGLVVTTPLASLVLLYYRRHLHTAG